MKAFGFGLPPGGVSLHLSSGNTRIPEPFRSKIAMRYEADFPGVYIIAALDEEEGTVALYHRTAEIWRASTAIGELVLSSALPAKGRGYLLLEWKAEGEDSEVILGTSSYGHAIHAWTRDRGRALAEMIGCPFLELPPEMDS